MNDSLDRCGLRPADVDDFVLVGGSSMLAPVQKQIFKWLRQAKGRHGRLRAFEDHDETMTAVAKGAAYQALALAIRGVGLVQSVSSDDILIATQTGMVPLIPKGSSLPYPSENRWAAYSELTIPKTALDRPLHLRLELLSGVAYQEREIFCAVWKIPPPVAIGDPLFLEYRLDEDQVLHVRAALAHPTSSELDQTFECEVENPLTHVVNPSKARMRVQELEELIQTRSLHRDAVPDALEEMADLLVEIKQYEKAVKALKSILQMSGLPDARIVNSLGMVYGSLRDDERELWAYQEAASIEPSWGVPVFNAALVLEKQQRHLEALDAIEQAIQRKDDPPFWVLKARLLHRLGRDHAAIAAETDALDRFGPLETLSSWEWQWRKELTRIMGDPDQELEMLVEASKRRQQARHRPSAGLLPSRDEGGA